jgi:hypothetical protein
MSSRRVWEEEEVEDEESELDIGGGMNRRRAVLRESEAEELRQRLDALLAELGRQRRFELGEVIRRPVVIATVALVAVLATVAVMGWRRRRD